MSQKYSNFSQNILEKLKEVDALLIKKYKFFLSGKSQFYDIKQQSLNEINKYYNDLREIFENDYKQKFELINNYFTQVENEFNIIDELLQNNKRIIDKGINNMNILIKQSFIEIKLSDQLQLIDELKLNSLLDDNINNKINLFLFQIKNNLLIPKINIDKNVIELLQQIQSCFSININDKYSSKLNPKSASNININNILDEKNSKSKSSTSIFMNNNDIYIEEESKELNDLIEDLCSYINQMELTPNIIWFEPNSINIYEIALNNNNKINAEKINYAFEGESLNNSFLFNEEFRVTNMYKNLIYITGGINSSKQILNNVYEYSLIRKTVIQKSSMNKNRICHGVILLKNNIYVCGGIDNNFNTIDSCEKFDINENKWVLISSMKEKLSKFNLVQIDNKAFAGFGGVNENNIFNNKIHYYRIDTDTWFILDKCALPHALLYPGLCKISSKYILIFGGINENNQETNEILKMDISSGNIGKINRFLDIPGYFIYSSIFINNEIHLLLNHQNSKYPDRIIFHL